MVKENTPIKPLTYPTRRTVLKGFEKSEDFRSGSGRYPFEYLEKSGELIDTSEQRRLSDYGVARSHVNVPTSCRACFTSWILLIGESGIRTNGVTVNSGSLLLIPPHVEFEHEDSGVLSYSLDTDSESVQALIGNRTLPSCTVGVSIDPRLGIRLRDMVRRELAGDDVEGGVLAEALAPFDINSEKLITPARERVACRARNAIDARLDNDLSIAGVCRDLGLSVRTVERAFRLRFQETMSAYIKRTRLDRARTLLLTGIPVSEAALEAGWHHFGRFSVEFKKRFGESPSTLRRRLS